MPRRQLPRAYESRTGGPNPIICCALLPCKDDDKLMGRANVTSETRSAILREGSSK
jgi:hypothetical protein